MNCTFDLLGEGRHIYTLGILFFFVLYDMIKSNRLELDSSARV